MVRGTPGLPKIFTGVKTAQGNGIAMNVGVSAVVDFVTEKQFKQAVIELAQVLGWHVFFTWSSLHSPSGEPDLRMVHPIQKRVLWVELKSERGKLTQAQELAIGMLLDAGAEAEVWRPRDWPRIEMILKGEVTLEADESQECQQAR